MIQAVVAKTDVVEKLRSALRPSLDEYKVRKFKSDFDGNSGGLFLQIPYQTEWSKNLSDARTKVLSILILIESI